MILSWLHVPSQPCIQPRVVSEYQLYNTIQYNTIQYNTTQMCIAPLVASESEVMAGKAKTGLVLYTYKINVRTGKLLNIFPDGSKPFTFH